MRATRNGDKEVDFWMKVKSSRGGCWTWTSNRERFGYGRFKIGEKPMSAHRFSWAIHYGPIPEGLHVRRRKLPTKA